ncbi:MAG: hypothetical protein RXQ93_04300 [Caldisphaera sp.]|jgi:tRNA splicing endonuclease|uniref:hypothetical protein n=1 Tax=Caldisphaera sp. TaxID=2060322 RepID=UPI00397E72A1
MSKESYLDLVMEDGKVVIRTCNNKDFCDQLEKNGLIINNRLNILESLYLIAIERANINGKTGWENALEIIKYYKIPLNLFLVYFDLRKRGRRVWEGSRDNTLISETPNLKKFEVLVLGEGDLITTFQITEWSELAVADSHIPVIAIVDKNGEITYYESRLFYFDSIS